jgi:hypothetical protein
VLVDGGPEATAARRVARANSGPRRVSWTFRCAELLRTVVIVEVLMAVCDELVSFVAEAACAAGCLVATGYFCKKRYRSL